MNTVMQEIREILQEKLQVPEDEIKPTSTLESLGADDLDALEVMMAFGKEFGFTIPETDEPALAGKTVQGLADYVTARIRR